MALSLGACLCCILVIRALGIAPPDCRPPQVLLWTFFACVISYAVSVLVRAVSVIGRWLV